MKIVQQIGGSTAAEDARILPPRAITIDSDRNEIRVHDGSTPGGHRVLNEGQLIAYQSLAFSAKVTASVPGILADTVPGQAIDFTASGTYTLPAIANADIGQPITLITDVAGVVVAAGASEFIRDIGVNQASISLTQYSVTTIAKLSTTQWIVLNKY